MGPPGESLGPLAHPGQVAELVAEVDRGAVDVARPEGVEAAGEHGQHRLVEAAESARRLAAPHQGHALEDAREAPECLVVELAGQGVQLHRRGRGGTRVAGHVHVHRPGEVQASAVGTPSRQVLQQPVSAAQPCHRHLDVTAGRPGERESHRAVGGLGVRTLGDQALIDVLAHRHRLRAVPGPPRCVGEDVEVVRAEVGAELAESVVGRSPVAARKGVPSRCHRGRRPRHDLPVHRPRRRQTKPVGRAATSVGGIRVAARRAPCAAPGSAPYDAPANGRPPRRHRAAS